jgi:hypothetical protein
MSVLRSSQSAVLLRLLAAVFGVGALALAAAAVYVLRLRCESFGCIGVGVAWFAWAMAYGAWLVGGLVLQSFARSVPGLTRRVGLVLIALSLLGAALVARWAWVSAVS